MTTNPQHTVTENSYSVELATTLPSGRTAQVTVIRPQENYRGGMDPAQVNWSALGSTDAVDALAYAELLAAGAALAATVTA